MRRESGNSVLKNNDGKVRIATDSAAEMLRAMSMATSESAAAISAPAVKVSWGPGALAPGVLFELIFWTAARLYRGCNVGYCDRLKGGLRWRRGIR